MGEFYEAVGIDAVLLVQHAGLNPMGSGVPPRAGCPKQVCGAVAVCRSGGQAGAGMGHAGQHAHGRLGLV